MKAIPSKKLEERRAKIAVILPKLKKMYPQAKCSLDYKNPFQLIIATILSAQCTDERVNKVTPDLFRKYPSPKTLAAAEQGELEKDIQSTGFFRNKAKSLRGMAAGIVEKHQGQVPQTMEELTHLPGVGRKTANVVLGNAFNIADGVVVDTHVARVSARLALTRQADPVKIEQDLMQIVPRQDWTLFSHLLIFHGREICIARKPKCSICPLLPHCPAGQKYIKTGEAR
jgi:endonuclease-3